MAAANKRKAPARVIVDKTLLLVAVFSLVVIGIIMVYSVTSADLASVVVPVIQGDKQAYGGKPRL